MSRRFLVALLVALLLHTFLFIPKWRVNPATSPGPAQGLGDPIVVEGSSGAPVVKAQPPASAASGQAEEEASVPASPPGTPGAGQAGGPAGGGGETSERETYLRELKAAIAREQLYPPAARQSGETGSVGVVFSVLADGSLVQAVVDKPCPHERLNQAALASVARAGKFRPLPASIAAPLRVILFLDYRLD